LDLLKLKGLCVVCPHIAVTTTKPFYSQASWGRLEMNPHEKKKYKIRAKNKGKTKGDKKLNKKGEKIIKR
jgi:hypothetical protein